MSTRALDESLREMKASHEKLTNRKLAMQATYNTPGVTDTTKTWLQVQISAHDQLIALLNSVMSGMTEVSGTDYPDLAIGDIPDEVQENLDLLDVKREQMKAAMAEMRPSARQKPIDPPVAEPPKDRPSPPVPEPTPEEHSAQTAEQSREGSGRRRP